MVGANWILDAPQSGAETMNALPSKIRLTTQDEAERLWSGAVDARRSAGVSLVSLFEALDLGIRAVEILTIDRLQPVRHNFPVTISMQLLSPTPEIDIRRDAVSTPHSLRFIDILDLLSEDGLDCTSPRLHRGWEDRRFSCSRSRATALQAIDVQLNRATRARLLLLCAYRNRVFRYPPPLEIVLRDVLEGFDALSPVVDRLRAS